MSNAMMTASVVVSGLRRAALLAMIGLCAPLWAQQTRVDLNEYYRFPFSLGVQYQPLSGIASRALSDFQINDISGEARFTFPKLPVLQPLLRGGVIDYSFVGSLSESNQDWTHRHLYGAAGLGLALRLSREFEIGGDLYAGVSQSFFTELSLPGQTEGSTMGEQNLVAGAVFKIALNPSYNFSISVAPTIRFLYGLGPLHEFDGFTYGVGFMASYRFGRDPDAAQSAVRAIRISNTELPPMFAAMQSFYATHPAATIAISNVEKYAIEDVTISFMQPGFMDSPSPLGTYPSVGAGETLDVPLKITFNDQVFTTQGVTPLTGEIIATYTARGRAVEQRQSVSYELYDRNALTWDDDRKVAAFITPQDSAIRNYASFIRQVHREETNPYLSENLQFAMQAYNALTELGMLYQIDPTSPFTQVQGNDLVVDSISLPRETLTRLTGDCDDLTVLYDTLLQSVGIETAFVTVPGHIYCGLNTGVASRDFAMVHPDRAMTLDVDGQLWVLVEITLLGRADFLEAWSTGIAEYRKYDGEPGARGFYATAAAQTVFRPVGLRETDLGLQYGDAAGIAARFQADLDRLSGTILAPYIDEAQSKNTVRTWNQYGVAAAELGVYNRAEEAFRRVIQLDRTSLGGRLNLGSLFYLREAYREALGVFQEAEKTMTSTQALRPANQLKVYVNLSKTCYALGSYDDARLYYEKARQVDPQQVADLGYLAGGSGAARASDAAGEDPILFFEDEE